jgi:hypothetical protein
MGKIKVMKNGLKPPRCSCGANEWEIKMLEGEMLAYALASCPRCHCQLLWKSSLPKLGLRITPESVVV